MRAIVLSDSHTNTAACERAISAIGQKNIDMIIHLGDVARDVDYLESLYYPIRVVSVLGNNDYMRSEDFERVIDFDGHKIFLCHGHTQSVSFGTEKLEQTALSKGCEAALFGHTHHAVLKKGEGGMIILNPGSVAKPRGGRASFAVLETENGKLSAAIIDWAL